MATISDYKSNAKGQPIGPAEIRTESGTRIYLLPVQSFPGHLNNLYLVDDPDHPFLFDCRTHLSHDQLDGCMDFVRAEFGVKTRLQDLSEVIVSHDMASTFRISHSVAMLFQGELLLQGTPADFMQSPDERIRAFVFAGSAAEA